MKTTLTIILSGLLLCGCSKQADVTYPKESLSFAGYATPDSAMETWVWAVCNGDRSNIMRSLTPDAQKVWEEMLAGKTDKQMRDEAVQNADKLQGLVIHKKKVVSDDTVILYESMIGHAGEVEKMEVKKIGGEWKLNGPKE
jgi:hypothetical protein